MKTYVLLDSDFPLLARFSKAPWFQDGAIRCELLTADSPHYIHVKIPVEDESGEWVEIRIPHRWVICVVVGLDDYGKIKGFSREAQH